jgi:Ca-activated chloride channel family protein
MTLRTIRSLRSGVLDARTRIRWRHYYLLLGAATLVALALRGRDSPATQPAAAVSSYGHMQATVDGKPVVLPLRRTDVKAEVVGVISSVRVTQHFRNPFKKPIEAVYVFPLPQHAAVHAMTMRVGERLIRARIARRDAARAQYERAKKQGKTASLLEQERPNIFTQSVANVLPGDRIEVELSYVEELTPRDGEYSFVFPMVVGPRYVGEAAPAGRSGGGWAEDNARVKDASRITPPLLAAGLRPGNDISLALRINAGVALSELKVVTHRTSIQRPARDLALIELDRADRIPNRDFVVRYALGGAQPEATLLAQRDARGGHFLLMVQPKRQMATADTAPKEYVFVVDNSGSMNGDPIAQVRLAMKLCLANMGAQDRFQLIRFASSAERFASAPLAASPANISKALAFVDTMTAGGGTEFLPALELALKAPRDPARARVVVFMTDGYIGYEAEVLKYVRENRGGASLFAFGVGSSVNRFLIDGMARIGGGEPFVLLGRGGEGAEIQRFFRTVSRPALTGVGVDWGKLDVKEVTPARVPDLFADRPILLAGRFERGGRGEVTLRGQLAGKPYAQRLAVSLPEAVGAPQQPTSALGLLWARRTIGELMDRHDTDPEARGPAEKRVTALALEYSLMSKWTSFLAIAERVRAKEAAQTVAVPTARPEGVSESAAPQHAYIGGALSQDQFAPGDPEVSISAPEGTRAVTLLFPGGEVKSCRRDPVTGKWLASFLIPEDTPDGVYTIRVLITLADGKQLGRRLRYQVDGTAPRVRLSLTPAEARPGERVELVVKPELLGETPAVDEASAGELGDPTFAARVRQELTRVQVLPPTGAAVELAPDLDGNYSLELRAPRAPGRYPITVVARDAARNKVRRVLWLTVAPR